MSACTEEPTASGALYLAPYQVRLLLGRPIEEVTMLVAEEHCVVHRWRCGCSGFDDARRCAIGACQEHAELLCLVREEDERTHYDELLRREAVPGRKLGV